MLGFRERTGGCGAGRSLRLALQHKLLLLAWRFEPTPTEVHSSSAKQPGSEALAASQGVWELAGEQQQSRSRGPGNSLRPAWGRLAARVLSTQLLPAAERIHCSPPLPHRACAPRAGEMVPLVPCPHQHHDPPHGPQLLFGTPVEEATLVAVGSGGSMPPHSARGAGDGLDLAERMESHRVGHLAGQP